MAASLLIKGAAEGAKAALQAAVKAGKVAADAAKKGAEVTGKGIKKGAELTGKGLKEGVKENLSPEGFGKRAVGKAVDAPVQGAKKLIDTGTNAGRDGAMER